VCTKYNKYLIIHVLTVRFAGLGLDSCEMLFQICNQVQQNLPFFQETPTFPAKKQKLVPDLQETVPGTGGDRRAVVCHAQTTDAVVVAGQDAGALLAHAVPHVAVEVVVAGEQEAARLAERHAGDAADDVVVRVHRQLLVGAHVEHAAGGVVGAGGERVAC